MVDIRPHPAYFHHLLNESGYNKKEYAEQNTKELIFNNIHDPCSVGRPIFGDLGPCSVDIKTQIKNKLE